MWLKASIFMAVPGICRRVPRTYHSPPFDNGRCGASTTSTPTKMARKRLLSASIVLALAVLHQDAWNWRASSPLLFGFLPPGLAYHAGFSLLSALAMAALVKLA